MRSNKNRTEQIPRILSPVLFSSSFSFSYISQCVCVTELLDMLGGSWPFSLHTLCTTGRRRTPPTFIWLFFLPLIASLCRRQDRLGWAYLSRTQCCWRVNALIDINLGHIVVGRLCLCVYTLLYSGVEKKKRLFDMEKRHIHTEQRVVRGNDYRRAGRFFELLGDPLSFGRRRRPSWALVLLFFLSCPCVGKHRDIPTETNREKRR